LRIVMSDRGEAQRTAKTVLLVGSGARPKELGAVLAALSGVRSETNGGVRPIVPMGLGDLEDLLAQGPGDGTLILESGRVPLEDIGFVRRFLERHSSWGLLVLGEDAHDARARSLLGLPRSQFLAWPPDLEQLAALLDRLATGARAEAAPRPAPRRERPRAPVRPARDDPTGRLDLAVVIEELLASSSLGGSVARYAFRCEEPLPLQGDEALLRGALGGLLLLANRCAGDGGAVAVVAERLASRELGTDVARVRIEFPLGPLTDGDLPDLLTSPFTGAPELTSDVAAAQRGARALEDEGTRVTLRALRPGRLRVELVLGPLAEAGERNAPENGGEERGRPEDPFA
jgi:hypothetical protein